MCNKNAGIEFVKKLLEYWGFLTWGDGLAMFFMNLKNNKNAFTKC